MIRFALSGGNFTASSTTLPGILNSLTGAGSGIVNTAPAGTLDNFAFANGVNAITLTTTNLGSFNEFIAGMRQFPNSLSNNTAIISFLDSTGAVQCDLRYNAAGQFFFTRNGTVISSVSTFNIVANAWYYVEFRALLSTTGTGQCEARVNGVTILSATSLTNASGSTNMSMVRYGQGTFMKDFYGIDTGTGTNTTFLGDVNIVELFPTGAGVNSAWTPNVGPFTLTSVNTTGVYQGTITGGASNAYVGYDFNITGFTNGANNVTNGICTASSATSITLTATTVTETHAGSAAFACIVQIGINKTGTRPNGDVAFIFDSTANDISDFAHQPLTLSGIILGVVHLSYARKDDAGTRQIQQVCLSSSATENSSSRSLGNSYQYWIDVLEVDPNTSSQWSVSGFNAATFGVKEIT